MKITRFLSLFFVFLVVLALGSHDLFAQYRSADEIQAERMAALKANNIRSTTDGYAYKCELYDNVTVFYVMPNDEILQIQPDGGILLVGFKDRPPLGRETEFAYMLSVVTEPPITYAVDKQGHIWQKKYPYKEIVGTAVKSSK